MGTIRVVIANGPAWTVMIGAAKVAVARAPRTQAWK